MPRHVFSLTGLLDVRPAHTLFSRLELIQLVLFLTHGLPCRSPEGRGGALFSFSQKICRWLFATPILPPQPGLRAFSIAINPYLFIIRLLPAVHFQDEAFSHFFSPFQIQRICPTSSSGRWFGYREAFCFFLFVSHRYLVHSFFLLKF